MFSSLFIILSIVCFTSAYDITITNNCSSTIWPAISQPAASTYKVAAASSGFKLASGASAHVTIPTQWSAGRIWARTGCNSNGTSCTAGDCGALECGNNVYASSKTTLAEFAYGGSTTWYDISLLTGYNLGMEITPYTVSGNCRSFECASSSCSSSEAYITGATNDPVGACADTIGYTITFCPK